MLIFFLAYEDIRSFGPMRIACVGEATAAILRAYNLEVELIPKVSTAENLAQELVATDSLDSANILVITGNRNREVLVSMLETVGHAIVDVLPIYDTDFCDVSKAEDPEAYSNYVKLPGIWVLIGGMWIAHFYYWGTNQYITQRALGAKSLNEAQNGLMFAGFLKILMPVVVVLPGLIAVALEGTTIPSLEGDRSRAYPSMLSLLPNGILGLTFAALVAAIVSSLASLTNSVSTIFTMDLYKGNMSMAVSYTHLRAHETLR